MATISVYLNGKASNANSLSWCTGLKQRLFRHNVKINKPISYAQLEKCISEDIDNNTDYIFSIGGDGTANQIVQRIAGTGIKLLVIPAGTANDLASELGITKCVNQILKIFQHDTTKKMDLINVENNLMLTNGGIGIANQVAAKVNSYRNEIFGFKTLMKYLGANTYKAILVTELLKNKYTHFQVHVESKDFPRLDKTLITPMLLVNNQSILAGNFEIAPNTKNDDGKFNVTIFTHKNHLDLIKCIYRISKGDHPIDDPHFITFETDDLDITSLESKELNFFGDGELLLNSQSIRIRIEKNVIELCTFDSNEVYGTSYSLDNVSLI